MKYIFQFMFDMLITLWYSSNTILWYWWASQNLFKGGTTFCGLGWSILSEK